MKVSILLTKMSLKKVLVGNFDIFFMMLDFSETYLTSSITSTWLCRLFYPESW